MIHYMTRKATQFTLALGLCMGVLMLSVPAAEARGGYSGGRSYSAPRTSYRPAPPQRPRVVKQNVTVNRTTVVHQNVNAAPSVTSGIMSSMTGAFIGSSLSNWWFNSDDDKEKPQEVQATAQEQVPAQ